MMDNYTDIDNKSIYSELTDISDNNENYDTKFDELKIKMNVELNKLNIETLKDKCKEATISSALSKLKKPELIQLLENEFIKVSNILREKSKGDLKNICKYYEFKKLSSSAKKEYFLFLIISHFISNLIFKLPDIQPTKIMEKDETVSSPKNETVSGSKNETVSPPLTLLDQLEKQKQEIERIMQEEKKKQDDEKQRVDDELKKKQEEEEKKEAKKKKQSIPKNVRMIVWNHYIGEDIIKHKCLCCKKVTISNTNFEVGHVLSEKNGGSHEINNLRPICFACNHSMCAENMIDFVVKYGLYIG